MRNQSRGQCRVELLSYIGEAYVVETYQARVALVPTIDSWSATTFVDVETRQCDAG